MQLVSARPHADKWVAVWPPVSPPRRLVSGREEGGRGPGASLAPGGREREGASGNEHDQSVLTKQAPFKQSFYASL